MAEFTEKEIEGIVKALSTTIPKDQKIPLRSKEVSKIEFSEVEEVSSQSLSLSENGVKKFEDLDVVIEALFGTTKMSLKDLSNLSLGSIVALDEKSTDPISLYANGKKFAEGEIVAVENHFGIRLLKFEE